MELKHGENIMKRMNHNMITFRIIKKYILLIIFGGIILGAV